MDEQLTAEELQVLIDVLAQVNVTVAQAQPFIELIGKMARMKQRLNQDDGQEPPAM